jgi:hypothetical protein
MTLDDLSAMNSDDLASLYRSGHAPPALSALDGHPQGRMLAVSRLDRGPLAAGLRSLASATFFPWGGKSFAAGKGVNRVHLGGRHNLFPFATHIGPSALDGERAVILDYALSDNPGLIQRIHDEVREVSPGLFLGPAMWKRGGEKTLVLWFALDTRRQCAAIPCIS